MEVKERRCLGLGCDKVFKSTGERLCPQCNKRNSTVRMPNISRNQNKKSKGSLGKGEYT